MVSLAAGESRESGSFLGDIVRSLADRVKAHRIARRALRAERGPGVVVRGLAWLVHLFWTLAGLGAITAGMFLTVSPLAGWIALGVSLLAVDLRIDLTHRRRRAAR